MRLEDWVGEILADRLAPRDVPPAQRRQSPADELNAILNRMSKSARKATPDEPDTHVRTASVLESVAGWIEKAEERLSETSRHSADYQDRMASALSDALSALKDRLDAVERRVVSERAPARAAFPVEEAVKVLSPLADTLVGLRTDVSRLAQRFDQPTHWTPAVDAIRSQIDDLKAALAALATRDEVYALDDSLQSLSRDLGKRPSGNAVLTLAGAISALHGKVADLSDELTKGVHVRIGAEIEGIAQKIDRLAESGVDRSVIDFLSSQIIDMRHDLAGRAEPRQIEQLSIEVASLTIQIADLRANQIGRSDFASLKNSLEKVCSALSKSVALQEASDIPGDIRDLGDKLDALARRPEPEPANLDPIAAQLTTLTERMAAVADRRIADSEAVQAQFDRLSSQIGSALEESSEPRVPMSERFDRIEAGLRQIGDLADTSSVEIMVRSLHDKLQQQPAAATLDRIEGHLNALAVRMAETRESSDTEREAGRHLKAFQDEAVAIAEQAAKAAIREVQSRNEVTPGDVAALQSGFAELKALQTRADNKTQRSLRAVHDALETLVGRFADQEQSAPPQRTTQPDDRLEAAVRRLHAAALSQLEEVSAHKPETDHSPSEGLTSQDPARIVAATISGQEPDLGNVRASFIAAARRASQGNGTTPRDAEIQPQQHSPESDQASDNAPSAVNQTSSRSLIERIRHTFDSQRRPLLFSLALLVLAAGTFEILSRASETAIVTPAAALTVAMPSNVASPARDQNESVFQTSSLSGSIDEGPLKTAPQENIPEALRRAANAGNVIALYEVASRLMKDSDRPEDRAEAASLFEKAAQAGLAPAQARIASMYEEGAGVARNLRAAALWYERAAQSGNLKAMQNLASLLAAGVMGDPDYAAAFRWYTEAAEGGLKDSQFNLGVLLTRGIGTTQSLPRAYQWFDVAARQGDTDAAAKRDEIARRLDPPTLAAAKLLAERWRARPFDSHANKVEWLGDERTAGLDALLGGKT